MSEIQYKCGYCGRVSETNTVCIHGKAKVNMQEYRVVPSTRYDVNIGRFNKPNKTFKD